MIVVLFSKAMDGKNCVGAIVCKIEMHKNMMRRGYIAMLAVEKEYRRNKIGKEKLMRRYLTILSFLAYSRASNE